MSIIYDGVSHKVKLLLVAIYVTVLSLSYGESDAKCNVTPPVKQQEDKKMGGGGCQSER